jgi:hypothetical protein
MKSYLYACVCVLIIAAMAIQLKDFGPCRIMFVKVCVAVTTAVVMLLRNFRSYEIIFMNTENGFVCLVITVSRV